MYWETSLAKQGTCGRATVPKCSVEGGDMGESYRRGVAKHCLGMQLNQLALLGENSSTGKGFKACEGATFGISEATQCNTVLFYLCNS